jgi:predicted DNA binding protein
MRKAIIRVAPESLLEKFFPFMEGFFDVVECIEVKALLRLDFEKGVKVLIADIEMKEGYTLDDVPLPDVTTILSVLKEEGNTFTCLTKANFKEFYKKEKKIDQKYFTRFTEAFNVTDIIFDFPMVFSADRFIYSIIAENEVIKKILDTIESLGILESVSFQSPTITEYNLLSCLTERQKEVITAAKKNGYYARPRKITTKQLSKRLGISKATTIEHLRKAENRIISHILSGY